ncbi:amino acid ABC transporter permease [Microvirga sp. KLBC 81]|uniref:amino acid ABC transporter permease n=1 Tax=Microvirga sp. KLBC 81 TaxID=1862707 RepID=UPI000D5228E8|nr:amino acid ABC transporter permease [Microvirga sp. KLBC 81]PVE20763.1 amino acid ABC transporter permease [Microvirga sp. KLBC 81]
MVLIQYSQFLATGLVWTMLLASVVTILATVIAIVFTFGVVRRNFIVRKATFAVIEVLRDIPLIVTVLFTYFVLPVLGISLNPFWSAAISISLWGGANGANIIRAGLASVTKDQREAAASLGLRSWKAMILVILPQAMRVILPPYVGLITSLVQATSLGAVVGVHELLRSGQILIEQTTISQGGSPAFLIYSSILVVYFVICWAISAGGAVLERYFNRAYAIPRQLATAEGKAPEAPALATIEIRT